ncbi:hypothetical protein C8F04DRAFT_966439, partial [Mycena alexandri]
VTLNIILPLLSFPNLTHVELRLNYGFHLTDTCVDWIAAAWPRVVDLALSQPYETTRAIYPSPTIACLRAFARHCSYLQRLEYGTDVPPLIDGSGKVPQEALVILNVGASYTASPILRTVNFLSAIFPSLHTIRKYWSLGGRRLYSLVEEN